MIKGRESFLAKISVALQLIITATSYEVLEKIYSNGFDFNENLFFLIQLLIIWGFLMDKLKLGLVNRAQPFVRTFRKYLIIISFGGTVLMGEFLLLKAELNAYLFIAGFTFINLLLLLTFRLFFYKGMLFIRKKGFNSRQLLIIAEQDSADFIEELQKNKDWGYQIWGIIDHSDSLQAKFEGLKFIDKNTNIKSLIDGEAIDEVVYCRSINRQSEIDRIKEICNEVGVVFHIQANMEMKTKNLKLANHRKFITYQTTPNSYVNLKLKSLFDFYFSLFVVIFFSPTILLIGLIIKLEDGGPVFFKQERVGLNGRRFYCYKFRTMVVDAEALKAKLVGMNEQDGPVFKIKSDPRVTKIGKFLRETSIDELPQFFNVLKGEMSIVGPRPPVPPEVEKYKRWQLRRLSMKPGITCIWQVSGRNNVKFDEWMKMDMQYIDSWSLKQDFKIILQTIGVVFLRTGH